MRVFSFWLAAILALVTLLVACDTVAPGDCWVNTSGGLGGASTIPIGNGSGAGSGDPRSPPRVQPLDYPANPCVTSGSDTPQPGSDTPQPGTPSGSPDPLAGFPIVRFTPRDFPYITIVRDDGEGLGGGWQETNTLLAFTNGVDLLYMCRVHIGMPMRSSQLGKLSRGVAANMSAYVANAAAAEVWPTDLPQGLFCGAFRNQFPPMFKKYYPDLYFLMMP